MGLRGPKGVNAKQLLFFAELYYQGFKALAVGLPLVVIDKESYEEEVRKLSKLRLSVGEKAKIEESVEADIAAGRLPASSRRTTIRDLQTISLIEKHSRMSKHAARRATRSKIKRARPEVLQALRDATDPEQVRKICGTAFKRLRREIKPGVFEDVAVPDWPIEGGSQFPFYLSKHAEQFLSAKKETRFPAACNRPSTRHDKQLWFFACALAGAVEGRETRTVVNLLGSRTRRKVTIPSYPYSLLPPGELDLPDDLRRDLKKLEEQIAGDPELRKYLSNPEPITGS